MGKKKEGKQKYEEEEKTDANSRCYKLAYEFLCPKEKSDQSWDFSIMSCYRKNKIKQE